MVSERISAAISYTYIFILINKDFVWKETKHFEINQMKWIKKIAQHFSISL